MTERKTAFFVREPERLSDLMKPHLLERERPYEIVETVTLPRIDYENFATDMFADRQFIEDHEAACGKGEVWKCIFVRQRGRGDGVLVMPEDHCYVGWAAYCSEPHGNMT